MTDIDFMCSMLHIDDILAQMTDEEKMLLILLFIRDMKRQGTVSRNDRL